MRDSAGSFDQAGAKIVVVGQGTPAMLSDFLETRRLPFDVYCDPHKNAYRAFGLERGSTWRVALSPKVVAKGVAAAAEGHFVTGIEGDALQLPGSFVIRDGTIVFVHRGQTSSDLAPVDDLLSAVGTRSQ